MRKIAVVGMMVAVAVTFGFTSCAKKKPSSAAKSDVGLQRIHFDFDQSNIKAEFEPVLQSNAAWLQANNKKKVVIEGHCDERGTNEYNIALGDRRANSSKAYLQKLGISGDRTSTVSYGEERSMANCHDESCWWQNRRAEFVGK